MPENDSPGDLSIAPDPWDQEPVRTRRPWWFWLATGFGGIVLFLSAAFVALYYLYAPNLPLTTDRLGEINRTPSITLTDSVGKIFATRGAAFGYRVRVEEMPPYLPAAFIVTEDRRFYSHSGVDVRGLIRALLTNWQAGGVVQGGSTITQQLAKNTFLKPERTWSRKFEEMFLSFWLERHYSKDEILTLYLNRIYLGSGAYGVDAAAREYFGKSVRDVTLSEAAMLAALTRAPSRYSPEADLKLAQTRANMVVDLLYADGQLTDEAAKKAKAHPAKPVLKEGVESANYFADFVMDQLTKLDVTPGKDLIVRTTIDTKLQTAAQKNLTSIIDRDGKNRAVSQGALVAMEPSGAIRSLVGGKDYTASSFNRAYQARRQPGSSFKPFVYLAALEHGLSPDDIRDDAPYENRGWTPDNYDGSYLGPITLREALAKSVNTVAVRVADEVGRRNVIAVAQRLGITSPLEPNRSLPLGTSEVTLYEMTRAFAAFANHGNRVDPYVILDVKTADGTVLYEYRAPPPIAVMNEQALEEMNQMLFEVIQTGTGQRGDLDPRPAGAKTGTSQEWHDAWFVGFTADYITGVWVGNDDNSSMTKVVGGSIPASIWKAYMLAAHRNLPVHSLPGVDLYGEGGAYAEAGPGDTSNQDEPWVDRDGDSYRRNPRGERDKGVIEDFFDSLFGGRDPETSVPAPPPPQIAPGFSPQASTSEPGTPVAAPVAVAPAQTSHSATNVVSSDGDGRVTIPLSAPAAPAATTGPYRQPEPDPDETSPF
ncbi:MAG: PBP1A family penicillin-binding protein [Alphaproteobacteria bacterium]|nr:PBP1A family penicillin-binding protein [Alphaproteobacteria bacterium]